MSKIGKWFRGIVLFPVFLLLGVGADGGDGGAGDGDGAGAGDGTGGGAGSGENGTGGDGGAGGAVTLDEQYIAKVSTVVSEKFKDLGVTAEQAKDLATELAKEKGAPPASAPEKYADFKMPEGVQVDATTLEKAVPLFKELNLSQEQAQKLVEFQAGNVQAFNADKQARVDAIKADKELGGDNFVKVNETVSRAINSFLSETEQKDLVDHIARFGTSPGLARLLYRVGSKMGEDTKWETGGNKQTNNDAAVLNNMYPTMKE